MLKNSRNVSVSRVSRRGIVREIADQNKNTYLLGVVMILGLAIVGCLVELFQLSKTVGSQFGTLDL